MNNKWIGVDLDGTLAENDELKWTGRLTDINAPIPSMVERVRGWLRQGIEVRIMTARMAEPDPVKREEIRAAIAAYTERYVGTALQATNEKDFNMLEQWDDRGVRVPENSGDPCCADILLKDSHTYAQMMGSATQSAHGAEVLNRRLSQLQSSYDRMQRMSGDVAREIRAISQALGR